MSRIFNQMSPRYFTEPNTLKAIPGYPNYDENISLKLESLNFSLPFEYEGNTITPDVQHCQESSPKRV